MDIISTESLSSEYLAVNSCGCQKLYDVDAGSYRPKGRIDYHILYIHEGCCYVNLNGKRIAAPEGSIVLFLPFQKQDYKFYKDDKSTSYYIHFTGTACEQLIKELELDHHNIFNIGKSITLQKLFNALIEEFHQKQKYNKYQLQGLLLEILSLIARKNSVMLYSDPVTNKKFKEICKLMYSNIEKNYSINYYAKMCNLSESRFTHKFTEIIGASPKQYLIMHRIEAAKELLINSDMSVLQISEAVGILNQNYFSRIFKKHTKLSPSEYRKLH